MVCGLNLPFGGISLSVVLVLNYKPTCNTMSVVTGGLKLLCHFLLTHLFLWSLNVTFLLILYFLLETSLITGAKVSGPTPGHG